jgi:hypothetical protein
MLWKHERRAAHCDIWRTFLSTTPQSEQPPLINPLYLLKISINTHTHTHLLDPPYHFHSHSDPPRSSFQRRDSLHNLNPFTSRTDATGGPCTLPRPSGYQGNGACQWPITIEKAICWGSHLSLQFISFTQLQSAQQSGQFLTRHENMSNGINASDLMWKVW